MPRPSKLKLAEAAIVATLTTLGKRIFAYPDLRQALRENWLSWDLKATTTLPEFIEFIERSRYFKTHEMVSEKYGQSVVRYSLQNVSAHELALSLRPRSYLSHGTATELHQLLKPNSKRVYANSEQSPKPPVTGLIAQGNIDAAYARRQKASGLLYKYKTTEIVALNGKQTDQLGVVTITGGLGETISITNLERTLIDITVRPAYAGGAKRVLEAYRSARNKVSVDLMVAMLKEIDHRYPFHQAIGFLMSLAGFAKEDCDKLAALGTEYDFYVDYEIKQPSYSKEWRMYYPVDLQMA